MTHECPHCHFVPNSEYILAYWTGKIEAIEKPRRLGSFTLPKWDGHSNFYSFKCSACGVASVDYPHGYTSDGIRNGLLYLFCDSCRTIKPLYDKEIYKASGMPAPLGFWGMVRQIWFLRKRLKEGN